MDALAAWLARELQLSETLAASVLVAARVMPLLLFSPWLVTRAAPTLLRVAVGLVLTVAFVPFAMAHATLIPSGAALLACTLREALIGSVYAIAVAVPFYALDWAGRLNDTWRGAGLAEVLAPSTGERTSPLGNLMMMLGVVIFFAIGGHRLAIDAFAHGFETSPLGGFVHVSGARTVSMGALRLIVDAVAFSISLAAPAAVAIVSGEIALGLVARATPQIPVFFAGMPLRAAMGIVALLFSLSFVVGALPNAFRSAISVAARLVSELAN